MIRSGQKVKFMDIDKITKDLFDKYKSTIKTVSIGDIYSFTRLYESEYSGKSGEIVKDPFLDENDNYYCIIIINSERKKIFYEFIKHFTNIRYYVTLDENLFTL